MLPEGRDNLIDRSKRRNWTSSWSLSRTNVHSPVYQSSWMGYLNGPFYLAWLDGGDSSESSDWRSQVTGGTGAEYYLLRWPREMWEDMSSSRKSAYSVAYRLATQEARAQVLVEFSTVMKMEVEWKPLFAEKRIRRLEYLVNFEVIIYWSLVRKLTLDVLKKISVFF